jgi:quercetin dioxygenase-like cupin family protein
MRISRGREDVPSEERGPTVTGRAWADTLLDAKDDGLVVSLVFFEPGARTYWHHHEVGQVLYVTTGAGWIQTRDGHGAPLTVGDTVHIPAGEEHWHGGRDDSFVSHVAVSIGEVVWLEAVSDADYSAAIAG